MYGTSIRAEIQEIDVKFENKQVELKQEAASAADASIEVLVLHLGRAVRAEIHQVILKFENKLVELDKDIKLVSQQTAAVNWAYARGDTAVPVKYENSSATSSECADPENDYHVSCRAFLAIVCCSAADKPVDATAATWWATRLTEHGYTVTQLEEDIQGDFDWPNGAGSSAARKNHGRLKYKLMTAILDLMKK